MPKEHEPRHKTYVVSEAYEDLAGMLEETASHHPNNINTSTQNTQELRYTACPRRMRT